MGFKLLNENAQNESTHILGSPQTYIPRRNVCA